MVHVLEPALSWDILRKIAFICPRESCTTLMRTCTFFYHAAAASILHDRIPLHSATVAACLCFLHAGKTPRYPCVRHLDLSFNSDYSPLSPDTARALADVIPLMTGLVIAQIDSGEYTVGDWPALGDAIAFLPSLQQIFIEKAGPRSCQFLLSFQSAKLRSIKIDISDPTEPEEELRFGAPGLPSHPVQFFERWTSTLTELTYQDRDAAMHNVSPRYPVVYPLMCTLSIRHRGRLDPTPYICAFPNLAHLRVDTQSILNDDVHEYRTSNIRSQREVQHRGPASQHLGWRELVECDGSLVDLYALALNCRISHIKLDRCTEDIHLPLLPAVLADARPLHLNIEGFEGILDHPTDSLAATLRTQGASRLESLVVSCSIFNHTPHQDIVSALSSLAASLAMLPGPFRRLRMGIHLDEYESLPSPEASPEWLTITAANIDVEKIVQNLVESIPTLEDVLFVCSGEATDGIRIEERQATFLRPDAVVKRGAWTDDALDCRMLTLAPRYYPW